MDSNGKIWENYNNSTFKYIAFDMEIPIENETMNKKDYKAIPTGSTDYTRVNNIYDISENWSEWTTEATYAYARVCRGGDYYDSGGKSTTIARDTWDAGYPRAAYACRSILWIKE